MEIPTSSLSARTARLLPSVTDLIFILLLIAFTFGPLSSRLLWDADIGWHIRNGQNILAAHSIPHTDSFSATMSGQPWFAWEWLYDLTVGFIFNLFGLYGVVFFSALIIALTLAIVFRVAQKRGARLPVTFVFFALCTVASSIHFLARPHIVGWLMTVAWFWILDSTQRAAISNRHLFWLPPLMLLWVNLHGGFLLGFVLLGIFLLADIHICLSHDGLQQMRARSHAEGAVLVFLLSAAATLLNPYGHHLHVHVYGYLTNHFFMQHIDEFRAPNLHGLPAQVFLLMLLVTLVVAIVIRFRLRCLEWLIVIFSAASGLFAARNIPVAGMLLTMVVAPFFSRITLLRESPSPLSKRIERWRALSIRITRFEFSLRGHLWPLALVSATLGIVAHNGRILGRQLVDAHFDEQRFPVQAVEALLQRGNREPIFSLDSWGGYLIYRLSPPVRVFVDDRHDFYGEAFLRDYLKVLHAEPGWETVLNDLHVDLVLLPVKSKAAELLRSSPDWTVENEDKTAILLQRKRSGKASPNTGQAPKPASIQGIRVC
ncbi:MAG TPA: hypothetical protein VGF08_08030 [Terriglobales bacterium]